MSTQRLREAAKVLRERAERVVNSDSRPERAVEHFVHYYRTNRQEGADPLGIDAAYIATMHPGVGLALADWLDATARDLDWWADLNRRHGVECSCCDNCGRCADMSLAAPNWDAPALHAQRLADLILGSES